MEVWQEIIENPEHGAKRLIAEYRDRLYASALFLCTDPAAAEDLVYRTFERVIERVREHRPDSSFYAWIYTILLNFHRMNARREMRKPLEYVEKLPEIPTDDPTTIERLVMKTDAANLLGTPSPMIAALRRLGNLQPGVLPDSLRAMGIADGKRKTSIWATHPSLDDRIAALQNLSIGLV